LEKKTFIQIEKIYMEQHKFKIVKIKQDERMGEWRPLNLEKICEWPDA